eukprot:TRINITY_DN2737_c0_g2::TRINITY_DN2737_c0_g2_i1::g.27652::m.27652 TRINITY_DN2737_c0_g2::TRINITY_DN2737_c0_g2_i1::g.27652  ORF type:complete len:480 (-),score=131.26,sp/Q8BUV8/GP107_MOUSE/42.48/5e-81,Lung_7-TM_R/PF06814.8/2.5e-50,GpcrRhopsn4/PF10192.4/9.6e-09,GpcrRhopsn4/PF10192.4/2.5e+03,RDD/PF06271.7/1.2e+02,RDD/PF06271.7/4e+02,RDD/PF06271.7/0.14,DUF1443/PF07280.6/0.71,DUF1443/PF07280.6/4e+02,DUF1443/PF07280.6/2.7e+03 TRINITY_DN2737_c0_g2_i1:529-1944(-)
MISNLPRMSPIFCFLFLLFSQVLASGYGGPVQVHISKDTRQELLITGVGMDPNGFISISVRELDTKADLSTLGFVIEKYESESMSQVIDPDHINLEECRLTREGDYSRVQSFTLDDEKSQNIDDVVNYFSYTVLPENGGFYAIYFTNCEEVETTLDVHVVFYNVDPESNSQYYLDAGLYPLPTIYGVMCLLFFVACITWCVVMKNNWENVHKIHYLMTVLVLVKTISLGLMAFWMHSVKVTGDDEGWNIAFYVFSALRGVLLFVVIALIGTGWTLFKPFLSDKDMRLLMVVLPLQVSINIALAVLEEADPGSQGLTSRRDLLRLLDFICCCAILFPIVWSIKHLQEAASVDGKAKRNLETLVLFRQFYIMVVTYIYFTRIVVALLDSTLPYTYKWLPLFFTEVAALLFYTLTGYKFQPHEENPYLRVKDDDDEVDDFDIENDGPENADIELTDVNRGASTSTTSAVSSARE